MRLKTYRAHNYLNTRVAIIEVPDDANAVLIAGPNGSGKTAMYDALKHILTGVLPRDVTYKKELPELITDGEKDGWYGATFERADGHESEYKVGLKSGVVSNPPPLTAAAALSIAPQSFMQMEPNARCAALFNLYGVSLKASDIAAQLVKDGHDEARVEKVKLSLSAGFPATVKRAKELASEARGAWQATTGETYGAQKAEGWKAPVPEGGSAGDVAALTVQFEQKNTEFIKAAARRDELADADKQHAGSEDYRLRAANLATDEAVLVAHDAKIEDARTELANHKAAAAVGTGWTAPCPHCKTILKSEGAGKLEVYDPAAATGPRAAAAAQAAQSKLDDLLSARTKLARAVDSARGAKLAMERLPPRPDKADLTAAIAKTSELNEELKLVEDELHAAKAAASAVTNATRITDAAARYHADMQAYTKLADAVESLPARFLTDTLRMVNELLEVVSKAFAEPVALYDDMNLRYGEFPYHLLSESQKWRADLALGLALAPQSSGIVLMDRFDMVQQQDRGAILQMLGAQTGAQVIIGATLTTQPKFPAGCGLFTHWLGA